MGARERDYNLHLFGKVNARRLTAAIVSQSLTSHNTLARLVTIQGINHGSTRKSSGKHAHAYRFS